MSKVETNYVIVTSANNPVIVVLNDDTLDISKLVLFISSSSTESAAGFYDSSATFTGSSAYNDANTSHVITHYRNISGTKTKVFEATVNYLDIGEFSLNVTTCTQATTLRYVAFES